jgi:hypothetical protein
MSNAPLRGCAAPLCPWADMWLALRADDLVSETMKNKRWTILHVSHTSTLPFLVVIGSPLKSTLFGEV